MGRVGVACQEISNIIKQNATKLCWRQHLMLRIMEIMITINSFYLVAFLTTVPLRAQMSNQAWAMPRLVSLGVEP